MKKLMLTNHVQVNTTVLENEFIDQYMPKANGEYVKVYLLLLRHLNDPSGCLTASEIADLLECTEKDVNRALNYWKKEGLLDYEISEHPSTPISDTTQVSKTVPHSPVEDAVPELAPKTPDVKEPAAVPNIQQYRNRKERTELKELLFVAEQYLGKTLSATDVDAITYFYDSLHMSTDLIEYLIEYCVENGHKSIHYIQKVALSWAERNISTVAEAKSSTVQYNKNCYSVLNAFGIKGRAPATSETAYIKRWNEEYCFTLDIILEACDRTMNAIHQPSFEYTDSILKKWLKKGIKNMNDIKTADAVYLQEKEHRKKPVRKTASNNKFNNFEGRSYDMDNLERQLIQQ